MRQEALKAVHVATTHDGDEYYEVGRGDVTSIEWGTISGHMAALDTVRIFVNGKLSSEHPFCNCLSVFFAQQSGEGE